MLFRLTKLLRIPFYLLLMLAAGALFLTTTSPGKSMLASVLSEMLSKPKRHIEFSGIAGIWFGNLSIEKLVLSDTSGAWLQVDGISVKWAPAKLLSRRFEAEQVSVDAIQFNRSPEKSESTPVKLPVDLAIQNFDIKKIGFGDTLIPQKAEFSASGKLEAAREPLAVDALINAKRTNGADGTMFLNALLRPAEQIASIDFKLNEAKDGILAALLGVSGRPPVQINLSGSGPYSNWKFSGQSAFGADSISAIEGSLSQAADSIRLRTAGTGNISNFIPKKYRNLLNDDIGFELDARRYTSGKIEVDNGKIDTAKFFGSLSGIYDETGTNSLSGGLSAKHGEISLIGMIPSFPNIAVKSLVFIFSGRGEEANVEVSADIPLADAGNVIVTGSKLKINAENVDFLKRTGVYKLEASADEIRSNNETVNSFMRGSTFLSGEGSFSLNKIDIQKIEFINGVMNGNLLGSYNLPNRLLALTIDSAVASSALPSAINSVLKGPMRAKALLTRNLQGRIDLNDITVDGDALDFAGDLSWEKEVLKSNFKFEAKDVSKLSKSASGGMSGQIAINGPLSDPVIDAVINSNALSLNGRKVTDVDFSVKGSANANAPDLSLNLAGKIDGLPMDGSAVLHIVDGKRVLENLKFANGKNRLQGKMTFNDDFQPVGKVQFDLPDIAPLASLALQQISGSAKGDMVFNVKGDTPTADIVLASSAINRGDLTVTDVTVDLTIDDYIKAAILSGNIKASALRTGNTNVRDIIFELTRDAHWTQFSGSADANRIPFNTAGRFQTTNGVVTIEADKFNTSLRGIAMRLAAPTVFTVKDGSFQLKNASVAVEGGKLLLNGRAGKQLDLDVHLSGFNSALANQFLPKLDASGPLSGNLKVIGSSSAPAVDFDLDWQNASTSQLRNAGLKPLNIRSKGRFENGQVQIDSNISGAGIALRGGGTATIGLNGLLNLSYQGKVPFSILAATLNEQGVDLSGKANVDLKISGSPQSPSINGNISTSNTRFVHAASGTTLNNMAFEVKLDGKSAKISSLTGKLSGGGTVTAGGNVSIEGNSGFPADLTFDVRQGVYIDNQTVSSKFDAAITLKGQLTGEPVLGGSVRLARTIITVPEKIPDNISRLDVTHRNASVEVTRQAERLRPQNASSRSGLKLDIMVIAENQIFVKGRGIDAELGGKLRLAGDVSAPRANGAFELKRGRLSILGKRLDFTNGRLDFNGSLTPDIDFFAQTDADGTTVFVNVKGPANAPVFKFSSSPQLAEDEVLARLIFSRNISNLSPLQIVQLGQAVATLAGTGGNTSLLDKFQKLIKVDDLDVRTNAEGETTVGVGSYVNDRTYVGVERGSAAGSGKAKIDLKIGRGLKLRGEVSEDGKNKAGVFYEKEY